MITLIAVCMGMGTNSEAKNISNAIHNTVELSDYLSPIHINIGAKNLDVEQNSIET